MYIRHELVLELWDAPHALDSRVEVARVALVNDAGREFVVK